VHMGPESFDFHFRHDLIVLVWKQLIRFLRLVMNKAKA
jgi:hypothetical protein